MSAVDLRPPRIVALSLLLGFSLLGCGSHPHCPTHPPCAPEMVCELDGRCVSPEALEAPRFVRARLLEPLTWLYEDEERTRSASDPSDVFVLGGGAERRFYLRFRGQPRDAELERAVLRLAAHPGAPPSGPRAIVEVRRVRAWDPGHPTPGRLRSRGRFMRRRAFTADRQARVLVDVTEAFRDAGEEGIGLQITIDTAHPVHFASPRARDESLRPAVELLFR